MDQITLPFPDLTDPPSAETFRANYWRWFTIDHDHDAARSAFEKIYGRLPVYLFEHLGYLLAGPIGR